MDKVSTIGLDIAKNVFQVHGVDATGAVRIERQLRRSDVVKFFRKLPPCLVGMEACASAHYWGREIAALGHEVRLMPPTRVKPYVKWGRKNDRADAAACCEAVTRPSMRYVPIKTVESQSALLLHRARQLLVEQRTRLCNAIRAHLAEFGCSTDEHIALLNRQIVAWHTSNSDSLRLASIPQIGPIVASALVATAGDAKRFDNGRQFAAWLGLVPRQNSTGGKQRQGGITKTGDKYVRQLLVIAATGMIRRVRTNPALSPWFAALLARKSPRQAAVALANKMARIAWVILAKGEHYQERPRAAAA
jgi:transposase